MIDPKDYLNLKAWVHWVKQEKNPDDDRLAMAKAVGGLIDDYEKLKKLYEVIELMREESLAHQNWYTFIPCDYGEDVDDALLNYRGAPKERKH